MRMRSFNWLMMAIVGSAVMSSVARSSELVTPIDLSSFGAVGSILDADAPRASDELLPISPVAWSGEALASRLYVSGIAGASFATLTTGGGAQIDSARFTQTGSVNDTLFTGGGAVGMAIARPSGLLRAEIEGRARGPMSGLTTITIQDVETCPNPVTATATGGWSTLVNFWRDVFITDSLGMYAGGGFGVGGYHYSLQTTQSADCLHARGAAPVTTFAWQVGTGVVYNVSDRVTLDVGYRFFAMTPEATAVSIVPNGVGVGSYSSAFSASELLLAVRIYEPFRNWR